MGTGDTQVAEAAAEQGIGAVGVAQGGDAAFASLLARHANSVAWRHRRHVEESGRRAPPPGVEVRLSVAELSRSTCDGRSTSRTRRR